MATRVNPTRMELTRLKKRVKTAERGHKLLKDKRDEMVRQFMLLVRRNKELRELTEAGMAKAMERFSLASAMMGDAEISEALMYPAAAASVSCSLKNIMSVDVPDMKFTASEGGSLPYSFAFTSAELDSAVNQLSSLLQVLIELAECEKACNMLADEIEKTRRRVNALEYVMIPEMHGNIRSITMKLEENERGNLVRLMKTKDMMAAK